MPERERHTSTLAADPDIGPIISHYVARLPGQVAQLRELMAAGDVAELCKALHQLRGSGKSYGFGPMSELAGRAEDALAAKPIAEVQETLGHLIAYIENIEGYPA